MGKILIGVGLAIAGLGVLALMGFPLFSLPGDISVRRGSVSFYLPLTTSILLSVLVTLLFALFRR